MRLAIGLFIGLTAAVAMARPAPPTTQEVLHDLAAKDSATRLQGLQGVEQLKNGFNALDDSAFPLLQACADDPSPAVRANAALIVGVHWIQARPAPLPEAVAMDLKLAGDSDVGVRHDVVTAGLYRIKDKSDEVIAALVTAGMTEPIDDNVHCFCTGGCKGADPDKLLALIQRDLDHVKNNPLRAAWAYSLYRGATGQDPPNIERLDAAGPFVVRFIPKKNATLAEAMLDLRNIQTSAGPIELLTLHERGEVSGALVFDGVRRRNEVVTALSAMKTLECFSDFVDYEALIGYPELLQRLRAAAAASDAVPATQGSYASAFRDLYEHLGKTYPEFQLKQIDWKAVGDELIPLSEKARTQREFGLLVERLVAALKDSHATVEPGSAKPPIADWPAFDPGLACLLDNGNQPVVYVIEPNSPAAKAGIAIGTTVLRVDGEPAEAAIEKWMQFARTYVGASSDRTLRYDAVRQFMSRVDRETPVRLDLRDVAGKEMSVALAASCEGRYLPRLPVPHEGIDDSANVSWAKMSDHVGYIYVRRIANGLEDSLDRALRELGELNGLVIDVRGNSGGGFDSSTAVANFDPNTDATSGRPIYRGPIAMLIDERCISAGEGWASWFVANHRARLFGATTAGASSRKEEYTMSNGLYKIVVPVKPYTGFLDRIIEVRGIEPDVAVRETAADLAAGKDTVLNAAENWLKSAATQPAIK